MLIFWCAVKLELGWFDRFAVSRLSFSRPSVVLLRRYLQSPRDAAGKRSNFECWLRASSAHRLFAPLSRVAGSKCSPFYLRHDASLCCQLISCMSVHKAACSARTTSTFGKRKVEQTCSCRQVFTIALQRARCVRVCQHIVRQESAESELGTACAAIKSNRVMAMASNDCIAIIRST